MRAREVRPSVRTACYRHGAKRTALARARVVAGREPRARAWHRGGLRDQSAAALAQHAERLFMRQLSLCGAAQRGATAASALVAIAEGCQRRSHGGRARASRKVDGPDVLQVPARAEARSLELLRKQRKGSGKPRRGVSSCTSLGEQGPHRAHARRHWQRADGDAEAARRGARHRRPDVRVTQQMSSSRVGARGQVKGGAVHTARRVCVGAAIGLGARHWSRSMVVRMKHTKLARHRGRSAHSRCSRQQHSSAAFGALTWLEQPLWPQRCARTPHLPL